MILKCDCTNTTADMLHGNGFRSHSALVKAIDRPGPQCDKGQHDEYCCDYCSYTRTRAQGLVSGIK